MSRRSSIRDQQYRPPVSKFNGQSSAAQSPTGVNEFGKEIMSSMSEISHHQAALNRMVPPSLPLGNIGNLPNVNHTWNNQSRKSQVPNQRSAAGMESQIGRDNRKENYSMNGNRTSPSKEHGSFGQGPRSGVGKNKRKDSKQNT